MSSGGSSTSPSAKKLKTKSIYDDTYNEKKLSAQTSIFSKVSACERQIDAIAVEIRAKEEEFKTKKRGTAEERLEIALASSKLKDDSAKVTKELTKLINDFKDGHYFASLSDVWKKQSVNISDNEVYKIIKWTDYQRTSEEAEEIVVRGNGEIRALPYKVTREGAGTEMEPNTVTSVVNSETARQSASSQAVYELSSKIWPVDIFGTTAITRGSEHIAHLLPGGSQQHKEWMHVAAAVVGIGPNASPDTLKKAVRGFKASHGAIRRTSGSGVVHFVSNKVRMASQQNAFDGEDPFALLIPVMSLEKARQWSGEKFSSVFLVGAPKDGQTESKNAARRYRQVMLNSLECDSIRDATFQEVEHARMNLIHAILSLRDLISNMDLSDERLDELGISQRDSLRQAQKQAQESACWLPQIVDAQEENQKPLCLVEFGDWNEKGKHPPPDPLLLAYKAASVWAKMTGTMRLLANGEEPDPYPNMTEGDYLAETDFLEALDGFKRPKTWEDLAAGLGQPDGYQGE